MVGHEEGRAIRGRGGACGEGSDARPPPHLWEHGPGRYCGRRWHQPHVPVPTRLLGILLWVNSTTPGAFLQRGPVQELTKAFPNMLGGSEHPNIRASGCFNPKICPEIFPRLRGTRHGAHLRRDSSLSLCSLEAPSCLSIPDSPQPHPS